MSGAHVAILAAVGAPWVAVVAIFALGEARHRARTIVGLVCAAIASAGAIGVAVAAAGTQGQAASLGIPLLGVRFALAADRLGALFAVVAAVLWLVTTVYATGYMAKWSDKARFFGFFAICVGSAIGIALSANLLTLFVFYEALTLATYPLVVHSGTDDALKGGRTYLLYALTGGALLALGTIWLYAIGAGADFAAGGSLPEGLAAAQPVQLVVAFALLMAGFGVKAALFPAHGWLPAAMVAPAPVSALLHAVAVVKAGVFGIARVVLDVYGSETASELGVLLPLAALAAFTIVFASVKALLQDDIKKRLAYSTIGQLSYIVLGLAIGTPLAAAAALAHLAHHAVLKITMFFTAGALASELKVYRVSQMNGVGRRMPLTMLAFSVASLGIIGVPPIAGFVSKWGLGLGSLEAGSLWPIVVLSASTLLNASYLLPMLGRAWFAEPPAEWLPAAGRAPKPEGDRMMVWPLVLTAFLGLVFGPLAAARWAPASWAASVTGVAASSAVPWRFDLIGLDEPGRAFLVLAIAVWAAAGLASWVGTPGRVARYRTFFVLAAAGSIGLAFSQDPAIFYASFSVMALSAYGLIAHDGTPDALRAGRTYLAFTVVSESLLLAGLLIGSVGGGPFAQTLAESPWRGTGIALLAVAFGIKIGAVLLGGWMPGAYAAAPAGAGAALAGVTSTAGMLGLVRFLPGGAVESAEWGIGLISAGLVAAFAAALIGLVQVRPRHVLAYSSMSQFGLMTVGVGAGLVSGSVWPYAVTGVSLYLLHHGFAKAALFAGDDLASVVGRRPWRLALLALPALALAGLPLTSGAIGKVALKGAVGHLETGWAHSIETLLSVAAVGTTLLVARFLYLTYAHAHEGSENADGRRLGQAVGAFGLLVVLTAGYLWVGGVQGAKYAARTSLTPSYLWILSWPVIVGAALAVCGWFARGLLGGLAGRIAPGDVWAPLLRAANDGWLGYQEAIARAEDARSDTKRPVARQVKGQLRILHTLEHAESVLLSWPVAFGVVSLLALVALVVAR